MRNLIFGAALSAIVCGPVHAAVFEISDADPLAVSPIHNRISSFSISIDIADPLVAGQTYLTPTINSFSYSIFGVLDDPTPSGFPAFDLNRTNITNTEFYDQGSLFEFGISGSADLTDGLQISEFTFFSLDAREIGTGRYHPFLLGLAPDGSGVLQNSANFGGVNPVSRNAVDVNYGDEYMVELSFDPATVTIVDPIAAVPLPASLPLLFAGMGGLAFLRRRR